MERPRLGSVADRVLHNTDRPIFLVPIHERRPENTACAGEVDHESSMAPRPTPQPLVGER
jgi:hypothetical protein